MCAVVSRWRVAVGVVCWGLLELLLGGLFRMDTCTASLGISEESWQ